ncbi:MAG: DNA polymerase III subunit delta [Elusimicrobiota bacterium]|jgi:DNA polymerase-3 subunit delta|nr:DNA polymerase III subunit delta [Elusimicrobiota bacterium]
MPKLNAPQLEKNIAAKDIAPVYYFTGDDVYRKLEAAAKIKAALNPDEFNFTREDGGSADMGGLISLANTAPVFSDKRLIILNNADKLRKNSNAAEALAGYLANPLESTCLIVLHNDAKKSKKDKTLESACGDLCAVVNFDPLSSAQLAAWMAAKFKERGLNAGQDVLAVLEELVGADLTALNTEIEKLALYAHGREDKTITQGDALASVGYSKEENPFALSNAVLDCDKNLSLKLVGTLLAAGEEPISVLNKISSCAVKMLRIKRLSAAGLGQYEIVSAAGLLPWEGRLAARAGAYPPVKTLTRALDKIIETDMAFKSSQAADPQIMLKGLILTLFSR